MLNGDILRRLRYAFDLDDNKVIHLFALADLEVTRAQISDWLKKDDDPAYKACSDFQLASFLNGFIQLRRGKQEGALVKAEQRLDNNIIFRKLRIALNLKDSDILDILKLVKFSLSKPELNAFFRKPEHRQYRECKDQILRNFLHGLQVKHRPDTSTQQAKSVQSPASKPSKTEVKPTSKPKSAQLPKRPILTLKSQTSEVESKSPWPKQKKTFSWNKD